MSGMNGGNEFNLPPTDPTIGMSMYRPTSSGTKISDLIKNNENRGGNGNSNGNMGNQPSVLANRTINNKNNIYRGTNYRDVYNDYNRDSDNNSCDLSLNRANVNAAAANRNNRNSRNSRDSDRNNDNDNNDNESIVSTYSIPSAGKKDKKTYSDKTDTESYHSIRELANDVNNSFEALENMEKTDKKAKKRINSKDSESDKNDDNTDDNDDDKIVLETIEQESDYLKTVVEFLILLTLYVIMSQPFVVSFVASYIKQLNPSDDGVVNMTGIIIYGTILTVLFMATRKIIYSRFWFSIKILVSFSISTNYQ